MAKTRSQTRNTTIKKEEEDCKSTLNLDHATTKAKNKISKKKPTKSNTRNLPVQQVKVEEDTDTKSLLQPTPKPPKLPKGQRIIQEQINRLIDAIVNENMSVNKASLKVKIGYKTACHYYNLYKNDSEKKIPSVRYRYKPAGKTYTQEDIGNCIRCIVDDKMTVPEASAKAGIDHGSGLYYYKKYLKDPSHNIPIPQSRQYYTQDQKDELISYIVNDKMSISAASMKAKMNAGAGVRYYHKYFNDQNHDIATPSHITYHKRFTQEQITEVINYIIDDKMAIGAAAEKANMTLQSAKKHYRQYLKDNNMKLPPPKRYTQNDINKFIGYIVDDKMSITAASKKANMSYTAAHRYLQQYLNEHNLVISTMKYGQNKITEVIGYIVEDKMSIKAAAKKAHMPDTTAQRYYRKYLMAHNIDIPIQKSITKDQVIGYIVDDKLSIAAASKKANISYNVGYKCYRRYLNNQKRGVPTRRPQAVSAPKNEQ